MEKNYEAGRREESLYAAWEASGLMRANADAVRSGAKKPFTIPLPPPNVTGSLHLGHAAMLAIEDILIRYHKMQGKEVLWTPGTDHAAIATESVVRKHLGLKDRNEMPRDEFLAECRKFSEEKHDTIVGQMRKMGAWLDWSREAYTMDTSRSHAVIEIFNRLYKDELITRGYRMINWSVGAQSVLSDDELQWEERPETLYHIQCGEFVISTARPETKCSDSPVVVNPNDPRYKDKIGQEFEYETYAGKRKFYVLGDEVIDPEFGTGAMTISTAHDPADYDIAQRHNLPFKIKIDFNGRMTAEAGPCEGLTVEEARKKSVEIMREKGLIVKEEPYTHRVPICYRSGCVVEPMLAEQWFIAVEKEFDHPDFGRTTLKKLTAEAVRSGDVQILPERFNKIYFQWIDNLRDWCISRQIWWGHRVPVWYDEQKNIHLAEKQRVILLRHGESEGNVNRTAGGDPPLTPQGETQAKEAAKKLKSEGITRIISSPKKRAMQTAQTVADELGIEVEIWDELHEMDFGAVETEHFTHGYENMEKALTHKTGETTQQLEARANAILERVRGLGAQNGKVLLVGHNTIFSALHAVRRGVRHEFFLDYRKDWHMENASTKEIELFVPPALEGLTQDEDTLDTWFSSALWPFSTVGWPEEDHPDFSAFYPAAVLETGHDILFFWVARMIMFGRYVTGESPYHTVYLHGMVCDEHGQKMSKSKGNGIDPLDVIAKFGADPVRLSLVIGSTPGNPIPLGESKIGGYRNFVNKLWNAGRLVQMQCEAAGVTKPNIRLETVAEYYIGSELARTARKVQEYFETYNISAAGDAIYHFVWDEFCDWYLECAKVDGREGNKDRAATLLGLYLEVLKLTHPLCPFVTEAIWEELGQEGFLMEQRFPDAQAQVDDGGSFDFLKSLVKAVRDVRAARAIVPKEKLRVTLHEREAAYDRAVLEALLPYFQVLAGLSGCEIASGTAGAPKDAVVIHLQSYDVEVDIPVDEAAEAARKAKEIAELEKKIAALSDRLANPSYTEKAPEHLVNQTKEELEQAQAMLAKLEKH